MREHFPFFYTVEGLRPRERNTRSYTMLEFADVDVREVDESEAPVGIVIDNGVGSELLRYFEGRWWAKDRAPAGPEANIRAETDLCADGNAKHVEESLFAVLRHSSWRMDDIAKRDTKTVQELGLRQETGNDHAKCLNGLVAAVARSVIAVDGELYTAVPEPVLAFDVDDKAGARTRVTFSRPERKGHENRTFLFSVDRWNEMQAAVDDYQALTGIKVLQAATVEYRLGHLSNFAREAADLYHAAEAAVRRVTYEIHKWPREAIMAWIDLRDALMPAHAALKGGNPIQESDLDAVCEAMEAYKDKAPSLLPFAYLAAVRWRFRTIQDPDPELPSP